MTSKCRDLSQCRSLQETYLMSTWHVIEPLITCHMRSFSIRHQVSQGYATYPRMEHLRNLFYSDLVDI